jgi:hypothetical protein
MEIHADVARIPPPGNAFHRATFFDLSEGHYRHGRALSVPAMSTVHTLERRFFAAAISREISKVASALA